MPIIRVNDCELYYESSGQGTETVLFSHGLLFNGAMFKAQVAALKERFRLIVYDHRGQGRSPLTTTGYDMDTLTQDSAELIETLVAGPVHFVGLAMGGFVGLRLAARHPELIQSLTLINTSAQKEPHKLKYTLFNALVKFLGPKSVIPFIQHVLFSEAFLTNPLREKERLYWLRSLSQLPRTITHAAKGVITRQGIENELHHIQCPTLILSGSLDKTTPPETASFIHEHIPNSLIQTIPNAGHSAVIEKPALCTEAIESFLITQAHAFPRVAEA